MKIQGIFLIFEGREDVKDEKGNIKNLKYTIRLKSGHNIFGLKKENISLDFLNEEGILGISYTDKLIFIDYDEIHMIEEIHEEVF